ncbi:MAG: hypothetical protein ACP5EN_08110 [Rhodovulum sp.]
MPRTTRQCHLERRGALYYWRRRWPKPALDRQGDDSLEKPFLLFPLRTDVLRDAKVVARRLTDLTDLAFAACAEKTMAIPPSEMETLVVALCHFQIEAADLAREIAPARALEAAAYEHSCAEAALASLRQAIFLRDREVARAPLRDAADRLGIVLDEDDEDYPRLAMRSLEAMVEAAEETLRRDRGARSGPPRYLQAALSQSHPPLSEVVGATAPPQAPPATAPAGNASVGLNTLGIGVDPSASAVATRHAPPSETPVAASSAAAPARAAAETRPPSACTPGMVAPPQPVAQAGRGPTIQEITGEYVAARCAGYRSFKTNEQPDQKSGESWARNSAGNVRSTGKLLGKALPVSCLRDVTDEMLTQAWSLIQRLPRSYGDNPKETRTLQEIVEEADAMDARNEDLTRARLQKEGASPGKIEFRVNMARIPRMRAATVYRHMQDFQRICRFAVIKGHLDTNIMANHIWEKREYERRELLQEDNKREVWFDDLPALFRTPVFQEPLEDPGDPTFWAPVISVHSGLRSEEVLQLATDDIREVDGIPCIVLRQGAGQSLKSFAARRTVPIHQNLIELGLLELVALRRQQGEPRLFPWLERSKAKKTFTEGFSKRFTTYRKKHKVYKRGMDFHAFRTTFNQGLVLTGCSDTSRRYLMGHVENDVGITHYTPNGFAMSDLQERVNAIEIDISMIRRPFDDRRAAGVAHLDAHRRTRRTA